MEVITFDIFRYIYGYPWHLPDGTISRWISWPAEGFLEPRALTGWLLFVLFICHHSFASIWLSLVSTMVSQSGWTTCSWAPRCLLPGQEFPERLNILTTLPDRLFFGPECPLISLVYFDIVHWEYLGRLNTLTTLPDRFKYLWTIMSLVVTVMPTYRLRIYGEVEHLEYGADWELECCRDDFCFVSNE